MKLRPVTFRYRNDPDAVRQYGLVAEEVARVYPELVTRGPDGKIETVNYLTLTSMLLNELQKQTSESARQARQIQQLTERSAQQAAQNRDLFTQVSQLRGMFEQAVGAPKGARSVAAAFNR
jgi:Chaperone of endosialidase